MSIFDSIKNAIFGHKAAPATPAAPAPAAAAGTAPQPAAAAPASAAPSAPVDVEAILTDMAAKSGQTLNWRTSIVDLMKLLGLDSSITNRKALAKELGYTGNMDDSASMNIWLHKQVMNKLAANGGKVPASLMG
jgi:3-oxoacyl-ACP reductase-like protein